MRRSIAAIAAVILLLAGGCRRPVTPVEQAGPAGSLSAQAALPESAALPSASAAEDDTHAASSDAEAPSAGLRERRVSPMIEDVPALHPLVRDYLAAGRVLFAETHPAQALWEQGFYASPLYPGYHAGPLFGWLKTLRVSARCAEPVVGDIRVGDDRAAVVALLGEPHFSNAARGEAFLLTGYRFRDFYLIIKGGDRIEEITFVGDTGLPGPRANELLRDYCAAEGGDRIAALAKINDTPTFFGNMISAFGRQRFYLNGLHVAEVMDGEDVVVIFENYEGEIPPAPPGVHYQMMDDDSVFYFQRDYYGTYAQQLSSASFPSPDGNQVILPGLSTRPINGDSFIIHYLDESKPDMLIGTSHSPGDYVWLSDRYLLYSVYLYGSHLLDADIGENVPIENLFNREWVSRLGCRLTQREDDGTWLLETGETSVLLLPEYDNDGELPPVTHQLVQPQ